MFEQSNGNTPNKSRIKEISIELSQFGPISETNVYNWFQNRKARAKRKLQHQVGRRRRLTRSTPENNASKVSSKERVAKACEDIEEDEGGSMASSRVKRMKMERDHELQLVANEHLIPSCNSNPLDQLGAGSSEVEEIEGVLEDHLQSHHHHVDFATLATHPQLPNVDHITTDILFNDHHFHEPGTIESPNGQLISEDVGAWDVRNSFGESSRLPYHSSNDNALNFPSSLIGDKLINLVGYRYPPKPL
jgi:hypothetical protein